MSIHGGKWELVVTQAVVSGIVCEFVETVTVIAVERILLLRLRAAWLFQVLGFC